VFSPSVVDKPYQPLKITTLLPQNIRIWYPIDSAS